MQQIQKAIHTEFLRYKPVFKALQQAHSFGLLGAGRPLKILSFGCSVGDECIGLRLLFPSASIYGCDIKPEVLAVAERSSDEFGIRYFKSEAGAIDANGPYDIILAMSSLCTNPLTRDDQGRPDFRFDDFQRITGTLLDSLADRGFLVVYNSNYPISLAEAARTLRPVRSATVTENGFVEKLNRDGSLAAGQYSSPFGVTHVLAEGPSELSDEDFTDCIFQKTDGDAAAVVLPCETADIPDDLVQVAGWRRSLLDGGGFDEASRGRIIDIVRSHAVLASESRRAMYLRTDVSRESIRSGELYKAGSLLVRLEDAPFSRFGTTGS